MAKLCNFHYWQFLLSRVKSCGWGASSLEVAMPSSSRVNRQLMGHHITRENASSACWGAHQRHDVHFVSRVARIV